jgi:hypothetical protein
MHSPEISLHTQRPQHQSGNFQMVIQGMLAGFFQVQPPDLEEIRGSPPAKRPSLKKQATNLANFKKNPRYTQTIYGLITRYQPCRK